MSVNSEMTAIADLIRGLRGVSGKMGLDAMKGHLQDEQDGLDSALAALTEKGVIVPDGTKVDGLAALIAAIEAGGGSGGNIAYGTMTFAEDTSTLEKITHDLGQIPNFIVVIAPDVEPVSGKRYVKGAVCYAKDVDDANSSISAAILLSGTTSTSWKLYGYPHNGGLPLSATNFGGKTGGLFCVAGYDPPKTIAIRLYYNSYETFFMAGHTYYWIAGVI